MTLRSIEELKQRWAALQGVSGIKAHQRVDSSHPLDLYIGHDLTGAKEILVIADKDPVPVRSCRSIQVEVGKRQDGRQAVRFRLMQMAQVDVFIQLCWDLIDSSRQFQDKQKGLSFLLSRFRKWQLLMEHGCDGLLSQTVAKGLLGELLFLKESILTSYDTVTAIEGWQGPEGGDQDFNYARSWYEVKSMDPSSSVVRISSLEQLDVDRDGELVVMYLEKTAAIATGGITLQGTVNKIRGMLRENPYALDRFEDKLLAIGFIDRKEYEEDFYLHKGTRRFQVTEGFPRMRRGDISSCITGMSYELSIACISMREVSAQEEVQHGV